MSDMSPREKRVRDRAYDLWERAGKPQGKDGYFWAQAEREIAEEIQREAGGAYVAPPDTQPPPGRPPLSDQERDKP
jgi:Protein of unknown function (DUF2934)